MRGREIFGGLVPYGKVWRTGANDPTKIKFSDAVKIEGKDVPAGEYAFYTIPNEDEWTVILSKNTKLWGAYGYKPDSDALRVTIKPTTLADPVELSRLASTIERRRRYHLARMGENARAGRANHQYNRKGERRDPAAIKDPTSLKPIFYYQAASFYYDHDKDLEQAAKWVDQAIEKAGSGALLPLLQESADRGKARPQGRRPKPPLRNRSSC